MNPSLNPRKQLSFISKLSYISLCLFALSSCISISKTPLHSKNLIFKIRWTYFSPSTQEQNSFDSLVFVKGDHLLKLDILQPFIGVIASLTLNHKTITLQVHRQKSYYKEEFNSKIFFPDLPAFPGSWFVALLRAQAPTNWDCKKEKEKLTYCKTDDFEIHWKYKKSQLYKIQLKDSKQRQIKAQIHSLFSKELSPKLFEPPLKNLKRQKDPFLFKI